MHDLIKAGQFRGSLSNRRDGDLVGLKRSAGKMRTGNVGTAAYYSHAQWEFMPGNMGRSTFNRRTPTTGFDGDPTGRGQVR